MIDHGCIAFHCAIHGEIAPKPRIGDFPVLENFYGKLYRIYC
jgi:hypothetical protein